MKADEEFLAAVERELEPIRQMEDDAAEQIFHSDWRGHWRSAARPALANIENLIAQVRLGVLR